jgi:autotransporter strand-loop-strand O-heptosyltransferase
MKEVLINEYSNTKILGIPFKKPENTYNVNFVNGAFLEILGPLKKEYIVKFINSKTNRVLFENIISNNMWTRPNIKYLVKWRIEVYDKEDNSKVFEHTFNPEGKKVYIHIDSSALGDTLAWFPIIEEFRKENNCKVSCSTFHNEWFEGNYPELEFIKPGTEVSDLYGMFAIGWFYDDKKVVFDKTPIDFKKYPLQQTATEILGMKYREVKPIVNTPNKKTDIEDKYVVIAPHASAHAKYWNHKGGWQTVINYLNENGYKVVMLTAEPLGDAWHDSKLGGTLTGIIDKTGFNIPIEDRMVDIRDASAFIGVGSGLSWLSWALNTPTILISGFSYPYTEMQDCERIYPKNTQTCRGCFNRHWLNPGDWEWCPDHKDTPRQFECTKVIEPSQVIESLNKLLNIY